MTVFEGSGDGIEEVDILIAGGGTAACVLASRLAQADAELSIMLVEYGRNSYIDPLVTTPAAFAAHLRPDSQTAFFYRSKPSEQMGGQEPIVPQGKILGGSSSINHMMYARPQQSDLDSFNANGWGFKDLLPLFKKMETFHPSGPSIDKSVHGFDGPLHVSDGGFRTPEIENQLLRSAEAMGYASTEDLYDFRSINAFTALHRWVSPDGTRQDVSHRYLHPLLQSGKYPNLHVLVEAEVVRVIFDKDKRAEAVEYQPRAKQNPLSPQPVKSARKTIKARRMVVVSCGALGSPQVLERSGIGNRELLNKLNIPVIADLPGVGKNYQDHQRIVTPYRTSLKPGETMDTFIRSGLDIDKAKREQDPILGFNCLNFAGKIRPSELELGKFDAVFQEAWEQDYKAETMKPLAIIAELQAYVGDPSLLPPAQYITMGVASTYPYSRGSIHISGVTNSDPPEFNAGYLSDPRSIDLKIQIWAYKLQREIMRRTSFYCGECPPPFHPPLSSTSGAALELDESKFSRDQDRLKLEPLVYSKEDDVVIEEFVRRNIGTVWHPTSTCAMKSLDDGGVVNDTLDVYGVKGLKIVDLSILPNIVSANTYSMAVVVGEKAAEIVGNELGLQMR